MFAHAMIGTRIRGARGKDLSTGWSAVGELTQTGETCHAVHTCPFVQTGTGCTFVDVHLAEVTCLNSRTEHFKILNLELF